MNSHWKDWCWSWSSNPLATRCEELTHWKWPDAGKNWGQEEKAIEDEMVGWHHRLNGHELEQTLGDSEGQESLACCSPLSLKSRTWMSNWTTMTKQDRTVCFIKYFRCGWFTIDWTLYSHYTLYTLSLDLGKIFNLCHHIATRKYQSIVCSILLKTKPSNTKYNTCLNSIIWNLRHTVIPLNKRGWARQPFII